MNVKHIERTSGLVLVVLLTCPPLQQAAAQTISYPDPHLTHIYPAGGQQGQTVTVELGGLNGLRDAKEVLVDGPPGITVSQVKAVNVGLVRATFTISPDARPGRRLVRVLGGSNGLTNLRYFFVGRLPEVLEKEPNSTPPTAQGVSLPTVINGRLNPDLDVDCFRFQAKAGQRVVAAVLAHGMDSCMDRVTRGFLDTSLELLDEQGKVLATAEDTLGLDPLLEYTVKADGHHTIRIQSLGYKGAPSAVYRLTLGEVPYPTCVFPPGGQRGKQVEVEFGGPNVPAGTRRKVTVPAEGSFPLHYVELENPTAAGPDLPFLRGDFPEIVETEPNNERTNAVRLELPVTVNGRLDKVGDEDWYRLHLKKGQGVLLEVTAQRHLRSPVDTLLEVYDAAGKKLAENDDGAMLACQCEHDVAPSDSWLEFKAAADGDYLVRVSEQSGTSAPHAIYRLTCQPLQPGFRLYQWPDAVPVWGPGTTASFVVQVRRWGGLKGDIQLRVEGLPSSWKGSVANLPAANYLAPGMRDGQKALLTITAPADAPVGTHIPFQVVGRVEQQGKVIEHEAQPLTLYGASHNDRMHLRYSPVARAVVAGYMDCWLETSVKELTVRVGEMVEIPVKVHRRPGTKAEIALTVNGETVATGCGWRTPLTLKADQSEVLLPLTIGIGKDPGSNFAARKPGTYGIVVARSWASDLRQGRPGPCTPLILLHVLPAEEAGKSK